MVKEGMGYALVRAGRPLIEGLASRPIAGVHWTIDSALISKTGKQHPALPLLTRALTKQLPSGVNMLPKSLPIASRLRETAKRGVEGQMTLFTTVNAPDNARNGEGHRSKIYRHRK